MNVVMTTTVDSSSSSCRLTLSEGVGFCLAVSVAFVGSLYVLVPKRVRRLDRNHPSQIKWRSFATGIVCLGAQVVGQQYLLLRDTTTSDDHHREAGGNGNRGSSHQTTIITATTQMMLPLVSQTVIASTKVLVHVMALYTGPIVQGVIPVFVYIRKQYNANPFFHPVQLIKSLYAIHIEPTIRSLTFTNQNVQEGWITWRNLIIAPCLEEIAFRTCMVPVLLATGLSPTTVCWTAPLFFGVAHLHHAAQRLAQGTKPVMVAIQTLFQLTYTTLFGAYASYAYMQTQSTTAIVLAHGFCNWMGLPNFLFIQKQHILYDYRSGLLLAHLVGMATFGSALVRSRFWTFSF